MTKGFAVALLLCGMGWIGISLWIIYEVAAGGIKPITLLPVIPMLPGGLLFTGRAVVCLVEGSDRE